MGAKVVMMPIPRDVAAEAAAALGAVSGGYRRSGCPVLTAVCRADGQDLLAADAAARYTRAVVVSERAERMHAAGIVSEDTAMLADMRVRDRQCEMEYTPVGGDMLGVELTARRARSLLERCEAAAMVAESGACALDVLGAFLRAALAMHAAGMGVESAADREARELRELDARPELAEWARELWLSTAPMR